MTKCHSLFLALAYKGNSKETVYLHCLLCQLSILQNSMAGWGEFLGDMQRYYSVSLECLNDEFRQEQQEYFMNTSAWADIHPSQLLGPPACFKHYDLLTVTLQDIAAPLQVQPTSHYRIYCSSSLYPSFLLCQIVLTQGCHCSQDALIGSQLPCPRGKIVLMSNVCTQKNDGI